jgi:hypothetical protein
LFPAKDRKASVDAYVPSDLQGLVSKEDIIARLKSVLRREGFQVVQAYEMLPEDVTRINAEIHLMLGSDGDTLCGFVDLYAEQFVSIGKHALKTSPGASPGLDWRWLRGYHETWGSRKTINYGQKNYHKIPEVFDSMTLRLAQDLIDAESAAR